MITIRSEKELALLEDASRVVLETLDVVEMAGTPRRSERSLPWVPLPLPGGPRRRIRIAGAA